jgi:methylmalonyl-CoA/ethylmalonyl-CoA epimerase
MSVSFTGLSHINIVVDDINIGSEYYKTLFNAVDKVEFTRFKNISFAKSAGFMNDPEKVELTLKFLYIPGANLTLELMQYHYPKGKDYGQSKKTNDIGFGHISLNVTNIEETFNFISKQDIKLISSDRNYKPFKIDDITNDEFHFFDPKMENNTEGKNKFCDLISNTKYFYFIDKYGIQWEFEQN